MGRLFLKAIEKTIELKKINPSDPIVQDTANWLIDIGKTIARLWF